MIYVPKKINNHMPLLQATRIDGPTVLSKDTRKNIFQKIKVYILSKLPLNFIFYFEI